MKSILIICTFILAANFGFSQNAKTVANKNNNQTVEQSQLAVKQIRNHLMKNVEYPANMLEYDIEASVVIEVSITKNGEIETSKIVEGYSDSFDKAVLKAMENLRTLKYKGKEYKGATKLHIPVLFSTKG